MAPVQIRPPKEKNGNHGLTPLKVWVVRVWEVDPPAGEERQEWFLVTNEPVQTFNDAYRVVGWYECRWIVEAYHGSADIRTERTIIRPDGKPSGEPGMNFRRCSAVRMP